MAQGTVQQSLSPLGTGDGRVLAFNWTGDLSNGLVPVTRGRLQGCCPGILCDPVVVRPGSPSPSDGYSIMLTDAASNDFLGGSAMRLSATATQSFAPAAAPPALRGIINLVITGQRIQGARGSVYVYLRKSGPPKSNQFRTSGSPPNWPPPENLLFIEPRNYDFAPQTPGGNLFPGANTILLAPVPAGVNGSDASHYLYVSGGTGTAESCLVTGGTAIAGSSSGTLTIRCANSHRGDWSVRSATGGMQEAVLYMGNRGGTLLIPAGTMETFAEPRSISTFV